MLGISLVNLSLAISDPTTGAMMTGIEVHALESRVWLTSFGGEMVELRAENAQGRGLDRDTQLCSEAMQQMVIE